MLDFKQAHLIHDWTYDRPLLACRFDPGGTYLLTSAENNLLQRFSLADGAVQTLPVAHESWVHALTVAPGGNVAISGGGDGRLVWWDMSGPEVRVLRTVEAHIGYIRAVAVSPDGRWLVSGGYDRAVHLWELDSGQPVRSWRQHELNVYAVEFLLDSHRFLTGDLKGEIFLWELDASEPLAKFDASALHSYNTGQRVHFGGVRSLAVKADMSQLAAGGLHKATKPLGAVHEPLALRFSLADQSLLGTHSAESIPGGGLWRVRYLSDGTLCGVSGGSSGGFLLFWNDQQELTEHKFQLPSLARDMDLSADGLLVATAHHDRHLRVTRLAA